MRCDPRAKFLPARSLLRAAISIGVLIAGIGAVHGQSATPPSIAVAAASDLQSVFSTLQTGFERDTGTKVNVTFGSSGSFFAQIQNGAPFDVFMSADVNYPNQLVSKRVAEADTEYTYATGRIVLW